MANVQGWLLSIEILRAATILEIEGTTLRGDVLLLAVGAEILHLIQRDEAEFCADQLVSKGFYICHCIEIFNCLVGLPALLDSDTKEVNALSGTILYPDLSFLFRLSW